MTSTIALAALAVVEVDESCDEWHLAYVEEVPRDSSLPSLELNGRINLSKLVESDHMAVVHHHRDAVVAEVAPIPQPSIFPSCLHSALCTSKFF